MKGFNDSCVAVVFIQNFQLCNVIMSCIWIQNVVIFDSFIVVIALYYTTVATKYPDFKA